MAEIISDPVAPITDTSCPDIPPKENSMENLMEKLRAKSNQYRSWVEMSKSMRTALTEKKHLVNTGDRTQLQKVLDTLQKSIKVTSLQSMVERLESIARQVQGVRFSNRSPDPMLYIYNDMFYVEIILEQATGDVKDVKINHQADSTVTVTCDELVRVLQAGNFSEFTKHVEGLASIYQLNAEKIQKSQAFLALQALETDLGMLAQLKSSITEPRNLVHNTPVGILQGRRGGFSLKLTYFISPYDLLDVETKTSIPLTAETVIEKGLGQSVTVCIESSTAHKLQTMSLITVTKTSDGRSQHQFAALSNLNSTILPANFVLKLPKPIPMAVTLVKDIQSITLAKIDCGDLVTAQPLLSVIINDTSNGLLSAGDQGLWVTLPDQHHCYYLNSSSDLQGVMVSSIPFTHPTHVPQILVLLRQQMLFNTVISSCIRPSSKKADADSSFMFEGMAYSTSHILVSFEHPLEESLATVDIDLKDITKVSCKIYTLSSDATMCTDEYASKVMQRCLSIPITMRAVIRKAQGQQALLRSSNPGDAYSTTVNSNPNVPYLSHIPNYGNGLTNGSSSFSGSDFLPSRMMNKTCDGGGSTKSSKGNCSTTQAPDNQNFTTENMSGRRSVEPDSTSSTFSSNPPEKPKVNTSTLNAQSQAINTTNAAYPQQQKRPPNATLMRMLSDVGSAKSSSSFPFLNEAGSGKPVKRKRGSSGSTGRSPKRKLSEDGYVRGSLTPDGEICDSPLAYDACSSLPASLPSTTPEHQHMGHNVVVKVEQMGYPQRSASTDSYLIHDDFNARQVLAGGDSSRMNEGSNSSGSKDVIRNFSQVKNPYFGSSENIMDIKNFLASSEANFAESSEIVSDIDMNDDSSYSLDSSQSSTAVSKSSSIDKHKKKKYKEKGDGAKVTDIKIQDSSDDSSFGDMFQKTINDTISIQMEEPSLLSKPIVGHLSQPISVRIAKSGDGHKVSKSDSKLKLKDKKSTGQSSEIKRKNDAKKDRKRKKAESSGNATSKSPVRIGPSSIDSSLMPPPSTTSDTVSFMSSTDSQSIYPIITSVKSSSTSTSTTSNSSSKSPMYSKKSPSYSSSSGSSSILKSGSKSGSTEKSLKPSPPKSSHFSSDSEIKKLPSSVKVLGKHKQLSSSKSSYSSSSSSGSSMHVSGRSSPSKIKSTHKMKLPPSVTLTPVSPKVSSSQASMAPSSDGLTVQLTQVSPGSPSGKTGSNSSKSNKSALRARKCSLNAVIDKLKVNATTTIQTVNADGTETIKYEGPVPRGDVGSERKESKLERKDVTKESRDSLLSSKGIESKSKYSSSDQYVAKQSSQGIKLSITKTRASDGSSKSGKSKQSVKTSSGSSSSSSLSKTSSSFMSKSGSSSPIASKKSSSHQPTNLTLSSKTASSGSQSKISTSSFQKSSSPSSSSLLTSPKSSSSSSSNSFSKLLSKHVSSSSQSKSSSSILKPSEKSEKKLGEIKVILPTEGKETITTSGQSLMMPPPPHNKAAMDLSRSSNLSTSKRSEDRQSPRLTPTRDYGNDEIESEKTFRYMKVQAKSSDITSSTPIQQPTEYGSNSGTATKSSQFHTGSVVVDYSQGFITLDTSMKDTDVQWVSSSSDMKIPQSASLRHSSLELPTKDSAMGNSLEPSLSSKHDMTHNAHMTSSSEEIQKSPAPLLMKHTKRLPGTPDEDSLDECLVIDCDNEEKWSPRVVEPSIVMKRVLEDKLDSSEKSPVTYSHLNQPSSLIKSPVPSSSISSSNHSRPRSYDSIDDDLMNEALMPIAEK